jgi:hypothetical protein
MKRPPILLALAALFCTIAPLPADEVPHLQFVRELRARYPDLALEYLNNLRQSNPPPEVAAVIPLELAKVRLDLATAEADGTRRLALYNQARAEIQEFIDKNPNNPLVADARLEVAHVTVLQGRTQLSRALAQDDVAARQRDALPARQTFEEAQKQLQAVADLLDKQVKATEDAKIKQTLEQARLQAQMDIGLSYIDQATTYVDEARQEIALARAKVLTQAQPVLDKVAKEADQDYPAIAWQARAWSAHCSHQNGDTKKALAKLDEVLARTEAAAAPGKRLALFFRMKVLLDPPAVPKEADLAQARKDGEAWLADYPRYKDTPEGCGARYYLADVLLRQAAELKENKDRAARTQLLTRAEGLCRELMRSENDYGERARGLSIQVIAASGGFNKEIAKLDSFEACLVRAEYEARQIEAFARKGDAKPEDVEKERKLRLGNAVEALNLALDLARKPGAKVPPAEVVKARALLCGYYLFAGKNKEAIAVGEEAARTLPPTSQSAQAAMYVLEAYHKQINESLRNGSATLADLSQREADGKPSVIERMTDLAQMMEQRWPADQAGDVARHMRGLLLIRQKKQAEAVEVLARVSPNYSAAIYAKSALAEAAAQAAQDRSAQAKVEPDKVKKEQLAKEEAQFEKQRLDALKGMPPLPAGADALTTGIYLNSRIELAGAYYRNKEYGEIKKLVDPLLAGLKGLKFDSEARRGEAQASLVVLKLFAKFGAANAELAAGHVPKAKEVIDPVVEAIRKGEYADELKKNPELRWGLMGLALRVSIQEGNTARALEVLQAVQKFAADAGEGGNKGFLIQLARMVRDQMGEVRKKKDKDALKDAADKYGKFLDELRKGEKAPTADFLRATAEAYAALDRHETAVELARQVPEPKGDDAKDERKVGNYRYCRILIVRELRLDGKLEEAGAELDELRKAPWGKDHPEAIKEGIHLIAAKGTPGKAYVEWSKLVKQLSDKFQQPGMKEQYFECYYYMTECWLKHAQALKVPKQREDGIKRAASFITKLETAWPEMGGDESKARFTDLLERELELKEQYDKMKAEK